MTILFSASVRGGRALQPQYVQIVELLQQYGTVLSEEIADEKFSGFGETDLTKEEIHDREIQSIEQCDVMVADVTTPSLGVGYLIANALQRDKKVICLYQGEDTYKLSAMIKGSDKVQVHTYMNPEDLKSLFDSELHTSE